jgi:hypothetical protein
MVNSARRTVANTPLRARKKGHGDRDAGHPTSVTLRGGIGRAIDDSKRDPEDMGQWVRLEGCSRL